MSQVDFCYVDENEWTIYRTSFKKYLNAQSISEKPSGEWTRLSFEKYLKNRSDKQLMSHERPELPKLVRETEAVFFFLVEQGNKNGFNVDTILEIPDAIGQTCFFTASHFSEKICNYIIGRPIQVNSITLEMMIPYLEFRALWVRMLKKGINPNVMDLYGRKSFPYQKSSFVYNGKFRLLLCGFPRSVHFSIEDINCQETCPANCPSKFKRFYYKNGALIEMNDKNRIGSGGFGMVFRGLFHGESMAMKCLMTEEIEFKNFIRDTVSDLERNISEIRIQLATAGSGVIVPVAFVRQQNQEKDENGKWIAENYNIFIYPLYDCNLYEFHENHYNQLTEENLNDMLHQCLTRKCSNKPFSEFNLNLKPNTT